MAARVRGFPRFWAAGLLHVWFHTLRPEDWFGGGAVVNRLLHRRFARDLAMLATQPPWRFLTDPRAALAAVLLFDQLPRNLFGGTPAAFAHDRLARAITRGALARRWDLPLAPVERQFLYMPLMHSEGIADQRLSVALFARMQRRFGLPFARDHHEMIARFGRFPHRNAVLGRASMPGEQRALTAGFGW